MAGCSACGHQIDCPNGCGLFCTSDCEDCTQWCEPTTVEASSPGVLIRITKKADRGARILVGDKANTPGAEMPRYPASTEFRLSFHDLSRASLARLLGHMHTGTVRAADHHSTEKLSGSGTGTVAELAAKFSLLVD